MLYSCADDRPLDEWLHSVQLEHGASLDHKWTHTDYLVEAHGSRDLDSSPMSLDPSPMDVCCSPALHSSPMDLYVSPYCTVSASPLAVAQAPDGFMSSPIEWLSGD